MKPQKKNLTSYLHLNLLTLLILYPIFTKLIQINLAFFHYHNINLLSFSFSSLFSYFFLSLSSLSILKLEVVWFVSDPSSLGAEITALNILYTTMAKLLRLCVKAKNSGL